MARIVIKLVILYVSMLALVEHVQLSFLPKQFQNEACFRVEGIGSDSSLDVHFLYNSVFLACKCQWLPVGSKDK